MIFARPVRLLNPDGALPLDGCRKAAAGLLNASRSHPQKCPLGAVSYTSPDVYFLEVCLLHQVCANGAELFAPRAKSAAGEATSAPNIFRCDYSPTRMEELFAILGATHG